ncbi:unnamed protein product, partial [Caretta caretta]
AFYTNIPHKDGLQAVKNTIPDNVTANLVAELCDFVLTHNYFTFGDNVYLQISGTAMGTRMAPQYANIFMADLEQHFLSSRPLTPLLCLRYTDDIFIIWTHGKEALEEFHHDFNNFHPTINLSLAKDDPTSTYDEDNMEQCIFDLFLAGTETTISTLRWALLYMVAYVNIQD